jgi:hypothetical protein
VTVIEVPLPERRLFAAFLRDLTAAREAEAALREVQASCISHGLRP